MIINQLMKNNFSKSFILHFLLFLLLFQYQFVSSNSKLLNNIIRLGNPFIFNHISVNSEGDMIIDSGSEILTKERKFYGIKKNGKEYFTNKVGNKDYHSSMTIQSGYGRIHGESSFVKVRSNIQNYNKKEFILGISKVKNEKYNVEIYNLENGIYYTLSTRDIFGDITSNVFSIVKDPLTASTRYNYFISYIIVSSENKYVFCAKKIHFHIISDVNIKYCYENIFQIDVVEQQISSCFFIDNNLYICIYINIDLKLTILVCNPSNKSSKNTYIHSYLNIYKDRFFKGIHFKNNIAFFAYFNDNNILIFSLYEINSNKDAIVYNSYGEIIATNIAYYHHEMLNDLIKLNNNTVCFVDSSLDKQYINIIVFNFYNNDNYMNYRHFRINLLTDYSLRIFSEVRLGLFNNHLALAFSHYIQENNTISNSDYYSSLILFNYPNSSNINLDIIQYLYPNNKTMNDEIIINLEEKLVIENNLFGYVFKGTKIINYSNEISLINNNNTIIFGNIIESGEEIRLKFKSNKFYNKGNYSIEFAYVLTEPDYGTINKYMAFINETYGNLKKNEKEYYQNHEYTGKYSNFNAIISDNLTTECEEENCSLCYANRIQECITCKDIFYINKTNNLKLCNVPKSQNNNIEISTLFTNTNTQNETQYETQFQNNSTEILNQNITDIKIETNIEIIEPKEEIINIIGCKDDEILSGRCGLKITNEQIASFYNELKSQIKANTSKIIKTENVIFQISSLNEQKGNDNPNVSSIDLGECETILKNNSGLKDDEDLIVYKIDIKNKDLSQTYVQYEIYNPQNLELMSLDACKDISISVKIPINLNEETQSIYDSLVQSGYNLFDINDIFYNDICSTYTTENGTDLTLADRKNIIYDNNGNISMCQEGCEFLFYNITTKKSECNCAIQTSEIVTNIDEINFEFSSLSDEFFNTINNSNFRVLKCFKLVFSKKGQKKNIGSYIMSGLCIIFLILLLIYIIKENSKVNNYIKDILKQKQEIAKSNGEYISKSKKNDNLFGENNPINIINIKSNETKTKNKNKSTSKINKRNNRKKRKNNKSTNSFPPKRKVNNSKISENSNFKKSFESLNSRQSKTIDEIKTEKNLKNLIPQKKRKKVINIFNVDNSVNKSSNNQSVNNKGNNLIQNTQDFLKNNKITDITDEEKNNLEYEIALVVDKRTYFQYYYSLIKKKQLLLFAFCPNKDYNLTLIKMSLLILSFSLYFTINGFFFTDSTMNKINEEHGMYNFLYQIPQMLYSTLISAVINIILKMLSLSQKQILIIKYEKKYLNAKKTSNSILKCLKIKLAIFFILSTFLMLFFWYFISCFCSVYKNTQKILITDTLISFSLSMIYPFILNLVPGFFRIPALRSQEKNKKYLYIFSRYLAMI